MKKIFLLLPAVFLLNSCLDLDVDNPGLPDLTDIPARSDLFMLWYNITQSSDAAAIALSSMADQTTTSWGDAGPRLSDEPRVELSTGTRGVDITDLYSDLYHSLTYANDVLGLISFGATFSYDEQDLNPDMMKAWGRFIQGISLGYLGLCFDRAVIVKETTPTNYTTLSPYDNIILAAIESLNQCIDICSNKTFVLPSDFVSGMTVNQDMLKQLANAFAARILIYSPRNAEDNTELPWTTILEHADNGIDADLEISTTSDKWLDSYKSYGTDKNGWVRIDHRIIRLMDPGYPARWPSDGTDPGPASGSDARLDSDFEYMTDNIFDPDRGYYHFSHYRYKRYDTWLQTRLGPVPTFLKEENLMILAEALARTGDLEAAIALVNSGSRTSRGALPPLSNSADLQSVLDAIFYERDIELIFSGMGISFFDMRRRDMLQKGTPLHFPIPFQEQDVLKIPRYTFGGVTRADGKNTSNGGWS